MVPRQTQSSTCVYVSTPQPGPIGQRWQVKSQSLNSIHDRIPQAHLVSTRQGLCVVLAFTAPSLHGIFYNFLHTHCCAATAHYWISFWAPSDFNSLNTRKILFGLMLPQVCYAHLTLISLHLEEAAIFLHCSEVCIATTKILVIEQSIHCLCYILMNVNCFIISSVFLKLQGSSSGTFHW